MIHVILIPKIRFELFKFNRTFRKYLNLDFGGLHADSDIKVLYIFFTTVNYCPLVIVSDSEIQL